MIVASQTIPIVSVAPLFIIWFGYGMLPKIIVVVLVCFFPVAISLLSGLAAVDNDYLELFRSMQASRLKTFRMVKLPLSMPSFFAGLRYLRHTRHGRVIGAGAETRDSAAALAQRSFQIDVSAASWRLRFSAPRFLLVSLVVALA